MNTTLVLSPDSRMTAGVILLTIVAIEYGGWFLLKGPHGLTAPVKITVQDFSDGLPTIPGMTIQPRPASFTPSPLSLLDPTIVVKSFTFVR